MTDQMKPARKASPFGTSNHAAAFSPPRASFGSFPQRAARNRAVFELSTDDLDGAATFDNVRAGVKRGQTTGNVKPKPAKPKQRTPSGRVVPKPRTYGGVKQAPVIPSSRLSPTTYKAPPPGKSASSGYYKRVGGKNIWVPNAGSSATKKTPSPGGGYTGPPAASRPKPGGPPGNVPKTSSSHWATVRPGDTVWAIAKRAPGANTTAEINKRMHQVIAKNPHLANPSRIHPGDRIKW